MTFSERVKAIRNHLGKSQAEMAESLGMTRDAYANFEYDRIKNENAKNPTIKAICTAFRINEDWLRTGEGEMVFPEDDLDVVVMANLLESNSSTAMLIRSIYESYMNMDDKEKAAVDKLIDETLQKLRDR